MKFNDVTACCGKPKATFDPEGEPVSGYFEAPCAECGEPVCESCAEMFDANDMTTPYALCASCAGVEEDEEEEE